MSAVNTMNQTDFIKQFLAKKPHGTIAEAQKEWRATGSLHELNASLFYYYRIKQKTTPVTETTPAENSASRSQFIRDCLAENPKATVKEVNELWTASGREGTISAPHFCKVRATLNLGPKQENRSAKTANQESDAFRHHWDDGEDDWDDWDDDEDWEDDWQTERNQYQRRYDSGTFKPVVSVSKILNQYLPLEPGQDGTVWLEFIEDHIDEHGRCGIEHSKAGAKPFKWDEQQGTLVTIVRGQIVGIDLPTEEREDAIWSWCLCERGVGDEPCTHTLAALYALRDRVRGEIGQGTAKRQPTDWRTALQRLSAMVQVDAAAEPVDPHRRLAWSIGASSESEELALFEQKLSANGKWSRGRRIESRSFDPHQFPWAGKRDQKVLQAYNAFLRSSFYFGWRHYGYATGPARQKAVAEVLRSLVGHPQVYINDDRNHPVEVRSAPVVLSVEAVPAGGYRLVTTIDGTPVDRIPTTSLCGELVAATVDLAHYRLTLIEGNETSLALAGTLASWQTTIPPSAVEQLLEVLGRVESVLPVRLPPELENAEQPADARITVRLAPQKPQGMDFTLVVVPLAGGQAYSPGEGAERFTAVDGGKKNTLVRRFAEERRRGDELIGRLPLDGAKRLGAWQWRVDSDDRALDVIAAIQAFNENSPESACVEWPQGEKLSVVGSIQPKGLRVRITDRRDWFGLSGSIDVAGEQVPLAALLSAVRHDREYVAIGQGKWARIEKAFRDRLMSLRDMTHTERNDLRIGRMALPAVCDLEDDSVTIETCAAWRRMIERLQSVDESQPLPATFEAELRDYQTQGVHWLRRLAAWGVGACLADDMGLGKTIEALAVLVERATLGPALVVAPTSVGFNWVSETERFAPTLRPILYRETDRSELLSDLRKGDLVITSYALLRRDVELLAKQKWGTLVLDEAQFLKNSQTQTAKAARQIQADWTLALTGTPLENHLGELWSIFRVLAPGLFGSWERFRDRFAEPIERRQDHERRQALARLIRPFVLRRTKAQVLTELPSRTEDVRVAELSAKERRLYENERLRALVELSAASDGGDPRFKVLAALTRLRQLACHPKLIDAGWTGGSAKFEMFLELVDEIREAGHRALVFSQFVQHLALVRKALDERGISYQYLDGQTPASQRKARVEAFQRGEGELFLISLKAGGTGLNLTAADFVIHLDPWWNPAVEDQATDRAHRIGQTRPVTVYRLVAKGTIEEQILALHADKRDLVAGVLDGADQAARLSTDELISLIRAGNAA